MMTRRTAWMSVAVCSALGAAIACGADEDDGVTTGDSAQIQTDASSPSSVMLSDGGVGASDTGLDAAFIPDGEVQTVSATSLGLDAFSANGRIQPHGSPTTYYFEYGTTTAYGQVTPVARLGPQLDAHYTDSLSDGLNGWRSAGDPGDLRFVGADAGGPFARFAEPASIDYNHIDGIGALQLPAVFYGGFWDVDAPTTAFGGGDPDFRDAKINVSVRGNDWQPNGSELIWWSQIDINHGHTPDDTLALFSNWGHTGSTALTEGLLAGTWQRVSYRLENDTTFWTYAGTNRGAMGENDRGIYHYHPLNEVLRHLDVDFFQLLAFVDDSNLPSGSFDFKDFDITYRNHNLLRGANGGKLISAPAGGSDTAALVDGWRTGAGRVWKSAANPTGPLEFVYEFDQPITIDRVQIHQNMEWPSSDFEVNYSTGDDVWIPLIADVIPKTHPFGPNFTYFLAREINVPAKRILIRLAGGYRPEAWGLGEIEVFGRGGTYRTDDDWYNVTTDITGLTRGQTYHYRLVALADGKTTYGNDLTYTVPSTPVPLVTTFPASRITGGAAKIEGRLNSLGADAIWRFEYGPNKSYGKSTPLKPTGREITPRTVVSRLTGLNAGATVHYRLVASSEYGTSYGEDVTFVAK